MPLKPQTLSEEFACRIVREMDTLFVEADIPTGGRMTPEEAEAFSVRLWTTAQEARRQTHTISLEVAHREATLKRAAKKTLGGSSKRAPRQKSSMTP
jgi:hypothetical protein